MVDVREIGSIAPQGNLSELEEEKLLGLELLLLAQLLIGEVGLGEAGRELEDGVARAGEGLALCEGREGVSEGRPAGQDQAEAEPSN